MVEEIKKPEVSPWLKYERGFLHTSRQRTTSLLIEGKRCLPIQDPLFFGVPFLPSSEHSSHDPANRALPRSLGYSATHEKEHNILGEPNDNK